MGHREVELKFLEIDVKAITDKILSLGAKKVLDADVETVTFRPKPEGVGVIRARKIADKAYFTVKSDQKPGHAKDAEEHEVEVSNFNELIRMLLTMGFHEKPRQFKHRTSYVFEKFRFEIDSFTGNNAHIPTFLEIEASSQTEVRKAAELLDLDPAQGVDFTQTEIIKHYAEKK